MLGRLFILLLTLCAMLPVACAPPASEGGFNSPDPAAKLYAIRHAANAGDRAAIPDLIQQLDSDDPAVRMFAIQALERLDGTRRGYHPYDPPAERAHGIDRWLRAYPPTTLDPSEKEPTAS